MLSGENGKRTWPVPPNLPVVFTQFIKSNVYNVQSANNSGTFNEAVFEDICEMAFKYNSRDGAPKLLITSRKVGKYYQPVWLRGRIETTSGEETYGLRLKRYVSFHGDLIIIPSRLFEHDYEGVGPYPRHGECSILGLCWPGFYTEDKYSAS